MYVVVGCPACHELWIREAGGERTRCPECRRTHAVDRLEPLFRAESVDAARDARTQLLAERADAEDAASFSELREDATTPVVTEEEHMTTFGIDAAEVAAAGTEETGSRDRQQIVTDAITESEPATADRIVETAAAAGVPSEATEALLERLRRAGDVAVNDGVYRLL